MLTHTLRKANRTHAPSSQNLRQILHFNLIKPSTSGSVPFVLFSLSAFSLQEASMCTLSEAFRDEGRN